MMFNKPHCLIKSNQSENLFFLKYFFSGFTLLEMLLVIVLLSMMVVLGINLFATRTTDVKVTKTVQQIQSYLAAAGNFYQKNGQWPNSNGPSCATLSQFNNFVPIGMGKNPWGGGYSCAPVGRRFQLITTNIPQQAAQQIQNQLPAALVTCESNICQLSAESAVPINSQAAANVLVKGIGTIAMTDGTNITLPSFTCPTNWIGLAQAFIAGINLPYQDDYHYRDCEHLPASVIAEITPAFGCATKVNAQQQTVVNCFASMTALYNKHDPNTACFYKPQYGQSLPGTINMSYIEFCKNPVVQQPTTPLL